MKVTAKFKNGETKTLDLEYLEPAFYVVRGLSAAQETPGTMFSCTTETYVYVFTVLNTLDKTGQPTGEVAREKGGVICQTTGVGNIAAMRKLVLPK